MDLDAVVIAVIALTAIASVFFTVVPIVPGTLFVPLGAIACGFLDGWDGLAWWFWVVQGVLVVACVLVDNVAQLFGVRRMGGSRAAMVGGTIGVFVGPIVLGLVFGPLALFIGPPIGAVVGTIVGENRARRAAATGARPNLELPPPTGAITPTPGAPQSPTISSPTGASVEPATYTQLGMGALVAFVVGTSIKLFLVTVQVALLVWVV